MSAALSVADRHASSRIPPRARLFRIALALLLVLLLGGGWLLWDNRRLDVTRYEVSTAALPAGAQGLRIAQVSDLHAADFGDFRSRVLSAVQEAEPDLIALTGDLVDYRTTRIESVLEMAEQLQAIAPAYVVLGNHEADSPVLDELLRGLEAVGVVVLRDEAVTLEVGGTEVTVAGIDDPRVRAARGLTPRDPVEVLASLALPEDGPVVLLAHRPELFEEYLGAGADLVLSGHAHGGQVRIPGAGGVYAPHQGMFPVLSEGVHEREGTTMVISRGLGNSIAGVRVNNPRELVLIDLRGS